MMSDTVHSASSIMDAVDRGAHNGAGDTSKSGEMDTVTLMYDRQRDQLDIGGKCSSLDLMLDILGRALRVTEMRYRLEHARAMQQAALDQARSDAIARSVLGAR